MTPDEPPVDPGSTRGVTPQRDAGAPPLADRLLESSRRFGQSAIRAYSEEEWPVFYLHLGTSLEQLAKAVLARAHPALLADPRAANAFEALLHLTGFGRRSRIPFGAVRTIGASEAIARVASVIDDYQPPSALVPLLLRARNEVAHTGADEAGEAEAILGDAGRYMEGLLGSQGIDLAGFWGDGVELVSAHIKRRLDASEASYRRRVQSAFEQFERLTSRMDEQGVAAYLAAVAPGPLSEPYDSATVQCPACRGNALLRGDADPQWEPDWDFGDGMAYVAGMIVGEIRISGDSLQCRACGLHLERDDLAFAGLSHVTVTDRDHDLSSATQYFARLAAEDEEF